MTTREPGETKSAPRVVSLVHPLPQVPKVQAALLEQVLQQEQGLQQELVLRVPEPLEQGLQVPERLPLVLVQAQLLVPAQQPVQLLSLSTVV